MVWKNGKDPIHIKASRVGTFTAAAKAAGRSVPEEAEAVLHNPNASKAMDEKAQFAANAEKWHH
jgi:hypothetical protein